MNPPVAILDLNWTALSSADVRPTNIFYLQVAGEGYILNAGFVAPPVKDMSGVEPQDVHIQPSARIYLQLDEVRTLRDLMANCLEIAAEAAAEETSEATTSDDSESSAPATPNHSKPLP